MRTNTGRMDLRFRSYFTNTGRTHTGWVELSVMHDEKVPPLEACREELLASAGLSEDEVQIESASWREMLIRMRMALVAAMRR